MSKFKTFKSRLTGTKPKQAEAKQATFAEYEREYARLVAMLGDATYKRDFFDRRAKQITLDLDYVEQQGNAAKEREKAAAASVKPATDTTEPK